MSRHEPRLRRAFALAVLLSVPFAFGCWEQMDGGKWFPQMKRQPAVQAYEFVGYADQIQGFTPPAGTVPVGGSSLPDVASLDAAGQDALQNPNPSTLASLKNGEATFNRFCSPCHGTNGLGDGPVAGLSPFSPTNTGPFAMVLPIAGPFSQSKNKTDGNIYATISLGRGRMPSYKRIQPSDRWDVINYIRELNGQGVRQ